jgi:hypothetical protein
VSRSSITRLSPLLLLLGACGFDVAGSTPIEAPAVYREWWGKTESCSGLSGDFDRIEWLVVPGYSFECGSGQCAGHWRQGHRIYIAEEWKLNEMVVRHEMLHDMMNRGGHPNPPFGEGCPLTWDTWARSPDLLVTGKPLPLLD